MSRSQSNHVCRRICAKSVRVVLERYSAYLNARGYSTGTSRDYVRAVEYFGRWLGRRRISCSRVQQFLDEGFPVCKCRGIIRNRPHYRAALRWFLEMMDLNQSPAVFSEGYTGNLLRRYQEHLATVRGLSASTISRYAMYAHIMLSHFGIRRRTQFKNWTAELIEQYVSREGRRTPSRGRVVSGCTRSFLRFLLQEGLIRRDLAAAVPTFARWRLASLPAALSQEEVDRLIGAADLQTPLGRRDHAIVLCMSELGLRASDVANLELDGVDFTTRVLRIRQRKEREMAVLPMTPRLCAALNAYLRHGRPQCEAAAVFIRHYAPRGKALTPIGICQVVLRLATQAGLRGRVGGTHVLRQSLASRMLSAGATLKQIADLLGHKSLDTTKLYAKVDLATLSRVALPFPGSKGVCS